MRNTGMLVLIAAAAAPLGYALLASSTSTSTSTGASQAEREATPVVSPHSVPGAPPRGVDRQRRLRAAVPLASTQGRRGPLLDLPHRERRESLGEAEGAVPEGTTVFDEDVPGVARLHPALLAALRQAATHAEDEGVEFEVNSGWRSPAYQERLLDEAVAQYGSEEAAARWVATPATSVHVSGEAVDIGPSEATAWLSEHGARYGLCQIYGNEPWHYELRPRAIDSGCPPTYADPTHDPRSATVASQHDRRGENS